MTGEWNFIKTTYDISLDSQISLLPFGFSLQLGDQMFNQGRAVKEESDGNKEVSMAAFTKDKRRKYWWRPWESRYLLILS